MRNFFICLILMTQLKLNAEINSKIEFYSCEGRFGKVAAIYLKDKQVILAEGNDYIYRLYLHSESPKYLFFSDSDFLRFRYEKNTNVLQEINQSGFSIKGNNRDCQKIDQMPDIFKSEAYKSIFNLYLDKYQ